MTYHGLNMFVRIPSCHILKLPQSALCSLYFVVCRCETIPATSESSTCKASGKVSPYSWSPAHPHHHNHPPPHHQLQFFASPLISAPVVRLFLNEHTTIRISTFVTYHILSDNAEVRSREGCGWTRLLASRWCTSMPTLFLIRLANPLTLLWLTITPTLMHDCSIHAALTASKTRGILPLVHYPACRPTFSISFRLLPERAIQSCGNLVGTSLELLYPIGLIAGITSVTFTFFSLVLDTRLSIHRIDKTDFIIVQHTMNGSSA